MFTRRGYGESITIYLKPPTGLSYELGALDMLWTNLLFRVLYRLRLTPWEKPHLSAAFQGLIEGSNALTPEAALDLGCGTGDCSIYLAQHGWQVTGVDFVGEAVERARAKAAAKKLAAAFAKADVTRLSAEGVGTNFGLLVDNGCLHGLSDDDRDAYVREVTEVAAPDARLFIVAAPQGSFPMRGISRSEIERRFSPQWELLSAGDERLMTSTDRFKLHHYLLARVGS